MRDFFNMDGAFYRYGTMLADIMILGFLWLIFSIPVFTIGASSTALYYVMLRRISNKEGYLFSDFWKSFKTNFKISTLIWMVILLVYIVLYVNISNIEIVGDLKMIILPIQFCFLLELTIVTIYIFPLISRFDMKFIAFFKAAFFMANRHFLSTILCVILAIGTMFFILRFVFVFIVAMGAYAFFTSFLFMRIFKKYRPEMDEE